MASRFVCLADPLYANRKNGYKSGYRNGGDIRKPAPFLTFLDCFLFEFLYTFAMASFLEVLLSGNYAEENIAEIRNEVIKPSLDYRDAFSKGSAYLEKMGKAAFELNALKGIGAAVGAAGSLIGSIPLVNKWPAYEFLQDSGKLLTENASGMEQDLLASFARIHNPGTGIFVDKMKELIFVYNHASEIRVDKQRIYLIAG